MAQEGGYWIRSSNGDWQQVPKHIFDMEKEIRAKQEQEAIARQKEQRYRESFGPDIEALAQTVALPVTVPLAIFRWIAKL